MTDLMEEVRILREQRDAARAEGERLRQREEWTDRERLKAQAEVKRLREERDEARARAAEAERRAYALEPEGQTIRELNVSVRVLREEIHEQRLRAQAAEARVAALEQVRRASETFLACHDAFLIKQVQTTAYAMKDAADALRALLASPPAAAEPSGDADA